MEANIQANGFTTESMAMVELFTLMGPLMMANGNNDLQHGYGIRTLKNGAVYKGQFAEGKSEGYGELSYGTSGLYIGYWKNDLKDGHNCKEVWPDGTTYNGEYSKGLMHGRGLLIYNNGAMYDGEIENNTLQGYGVFIWPEGRRYEGEWQSGEMQGYGMMKWATGNKYTGNWVWVI